MILAGLALLAAQPGPGARVPGCETVLCGGRLADTPIPSLPMVSLDNVQASLWRGQAPPGARVTLDGREIAVAADGLFLIAFDRDHGPDARFTVTAADGAVSEHRLRVAPRQWRIQRVNVARNLPREGEASWTRREAEVLRIQAARARQTDAQGWRQDFVWPARGRISGRFGSQRIYRGEPGSYHSGVDVVAATGTPVVAPADGVVVLAADAPFSFEGNLVILDHGAGLSSAFLHLSRIDVREGQAVRQGERIGAVGATGRASGAHLHWSLMWNNAKLDPERVVGAMR